MEYGIRGNIEFRNGKWEMGNGEWEMGEKSLKYHRLHPEYVHQRIQRLGGMYTLRVLLVMCDVVCIFPFFFFLLSLLSLLILLLPAFSSCILFLLSPSAFSSCFLLLLSFSSLVFFLYSFCFLLCDI